MDSRGKKPPVEVTTMLFLRSSLRGQWQPKRPPCPGCGAAVDFHQLYGKTAHIGFEVETPAGKFCNKMCLDAFERGELRTDT